MSGFANDIEAMAFDKSGWALVETSASGRVIYMGKPKISDATEKDPVWYIKKIEKSETADGSQLITTKHASEDGRVAWNDRKNIKYNKY